VWQLAHGHMVAAAGPEDPQMQDPVSQSVPRIALCTASFPIRPIRQHSRDHTKVRAGCGCSLEELGGWHSQEGGLDHWDLCGPKEG
ncbi:hypothetical protein P7K49_018670, partial [Saguinus oedipus]